MATRLKLAIAMLTWNRKALFERTYNSLERPASWAHTMTILDQGSNDGTAQIVERLHGAVNASNTGFGAGMNKVVGMALAHEPDIVLFTADDYEYRPEALPALMAFWQGAPQNVALACCDLEHNYPWNQPRGVLQVGEQRALIRATLPGANWSFRAADWDMIGPMREVTGDGEDLEICHRLTTAGYTLCALDLAEHVGERLSSWGNGSWKIAEPLDRAKWGV